MLRMGIQSASLNMNSNLSINNEGRLAEKHSLPFDVQWEMNMFSWRILRKAAEKIPPGFSVTEKTALATVRSV